MSLQQLYGVLLAGGIVLLAGIAAARTASRLGLPSLLLFLALGVLLGEDVLGIDFDDAQLAQTLGTTALAVILIEGGLSTRWADIRRVLLPSALLATVGVAVSVLITAAGAHLLLGMHWQLALLLGAIVSSTDAAAVFSVLRELPLPRRIAGMVEGESGFNDAPTVILVLVFSTATIGAPDLAAIAVQVTFQLIAGAMIGLLTAWAGVAALRYVALPAAGLYPLATVGLAVIAFAAAGAAGASGFIAAYLAGIVLGNAVLPHRAATRSFADGMGWLAQIGLFVMLGLLVTPRQLPAALLPATIVGLVLLLLARPVSVAGCLTPFRTSWRQQAFISWAGLRGAVPIVLATFPIVAAVPGSQQLLNIVFVLVVVFTIIQGPTLPLIARLLRLAEPHEAREVDIEAAPLDVLRADLLTLTVPPSSRLHGVEIFELRLPKPSTVTLIIRNGDTIVPEPHTRLSAGDEVLIVTTPVTRAHVERRLRAVGRGGRLAHWHGERGEPDLDPGRSATTPAKTIKSALPPLAHRFWLPEQSNKPEQREELTDARSQPSAPALPRRRRCSPERPDRRINLATRCFPSIPSDRKSKIMLLRQARIDRASALLRLTGNAGAIGSGSDRPPGTVAWPGGRP
ncbi:potassium/proton antiporter [Nonomuraea turkmeniaca]|uniref:Potassium/proton antiporter n=1 Tax=Nonomuraea turkmeniaca TaxID=103838 RepID=A0A5S4FC44_9ACTN|nr:potassium/proton antiporter [Nonomuraea turkmeniaca]TMR15677.1 potassium/proton antiporter [Nonomuraea turkmeniaca]